MYSHLNIEPLIELSKWQSFTDNTMKNNLSINYEPKADIKQAFISIIISPPKHPFL